jgi:hypothetical protein
MTPSVFPPVLACGAVLIALWIDVRFAGRRPESPVRRAGHGLAAFVVLQAATAMASHVAKADATLAERMLAFLALIFPTWTYAFLAAVWTLRTLAQATGRVR